MEKKGLCPSARVWVANPVEVPTCDFRGENMEVLCSVHWNSHFQNPELAWKKSHGPGPTRPHVGALGGSPAEPSLRAIPVQALNLRVNMSPDDSSPQPTKSPQLFTSPTRRPPTCRPEKSHPHCSLPKFPTTVKWLLFMHFGVVHYIAINNWNKVDRGGSTFSRAEG